MKKSSRQLVFHRRAGLVICERLEIVAAFEPGEEIALPCNGPLSDAYGALRACEHPEDKNVCGNRKCERGEKCIYAEAKKARG